MKVMEKIIEGSVSIDVDALVLTKGQDPRL